MKTWVITRRITPKCPQLGTLKPCILADHKPGPRISLKKVILPITLAHGKVFYILLCTLPGINFLYFCL